MVISKKDAKTAGLSTFSTGEPCNFGHICERFVANGCCRECQKTRNKELRIRNPERDRRTMRRYYFKNMEAFQVKTNNRRARKKAAEGFYTSNDVQRLLSIQNNKCVCGKNLLIGLSIDHKIPLSRGGSNWPRNLQLLCVPCNSSKGARTTEEWLGRKVAA